MVNVRDVVAPRDMYRLCTRATQFRPTRDGAVTDGRTLEGYAAVFDTPTMISSWEGEFEEVVKPGSFRRTLRSRRPVMQFDHGNDKRVGTAPIGSIEDIREDDEGLFVRARLFDTERVADIQQAVESQAIRGMSFKFEVLDDAWLDADGNELSASERADLMEAGELVRREITEVKLYELGPVVFPAYDETSVGVRSRSGFDPSQLAVRGVLGQFGLTEGCVKRHLSMFEPDARRALAAEIRRVFPELLALRAERTPTPAHNTDTVEGTWDADRNEARLPSPMPLATARVMYAWYDGERVEDGTIVKDACSLPHHEVNEDGNPGPANLNGVRNSLSRLPQSNIPESEQEAVRRHLRNHLPDGEEEDSKPPSDPATRTSDADTEPAMSTSANGASPAISHLAREMERPGWVLPELPFERG